MKALAYLKISSIFFLIIALGFLSCMPTGLYFKEDITPFLYSFYISFSVFLLFFLISRKNKIVNFDKKDSYILVSTAWLILCLLGALPYYFNNNIPNFYDAIFESTSGFTTTGASILSDIEVLPKSILLWRSLTHWLGGIGIIVLVIVILPSLGIGGQNLFSLESSLSDKIKPKISSVGIRLLYIYLGLTFLEIIFLLLGEMTLFDSFCHAFGTIATGGFSTKNTSIINYSPYIQYVIAIFMLLAGTNFLMYYNLVHKQFSKIKNNSEFKAYLSVIFFSTLLITLILFFKTDRCFEQAFRDSFFQVASILTCTGFATNDYLLWPSSASYIIFLIMFIGGSTGSTAGGIKVGRHVIAFKNIKIFVRKLISPRSVSVLKYNGNVLQENQISYVMTFIFWYFFTFLIGTASLILLNNDFATSASSIATAMGGIGPGFGTVGPVSNFAHLSNLAKMIMSFFMFLGRLEIITFLIIFTPAFWKK